MAIDISARFSFEVPQSTDVLLQFEAAAIPEQRIVSSETRLTDPSTMTRVPAQDLIGERIWLTCNGHFEVGYSARVEVRRLSLDIANLGRLEPHELPGETVEYLFDSRYCPA